MYMYLMKRGHLSVRGMKGIGRIAVRAIRFFFYIDYIMTRSGPCDQLDE